MMPRGRMGFMLAAALAHIPGLGAEVVARSPHDYPDPRRPANKLSREEKRARARKIAVKKTGVPGNGLWRRCNAANRVRGR